MVLLFILAYIEETKCHIFSHDKNLEVRFFSNTIQVGSFKLSLFKRCLSNRRLHLLANPPGGGRGRCSNACPNTDNIYPTLQTHLSAAGVFVWQGESSHSFQFRLRQSLDRITCTTHHPSVTSKATFTISTQTQTTPSPLPRNTETTPMTVFLDNPRPKQKLRLESLTLQPLITSNALTR